jgi:hypothetical protein
MKDSLAAFNKRKSIFKTLAWPPLSKLKASPLFSFLKYRK